MSFEDKQFPQTKKEEMILGFWGVRGYGTIKAVLGNLNVTFHHTNTQHDYLGVQYIYLEQFYDKAQEDYNQKVKEAIERINRRYTCSFDCDSCKTAQEALLHLKKELSLEDKE
jgi:hypothetical protein